MSGHTGRGIWRCVLHGDETLITAGADSSIRLWPLDKALGLGSKLSLMLHASWQALRYMGRETSIDEIAFLAR